MDFNSISVCWMVGMGEGGKRDGGWDAWRTGARNSNQGLISARNSTPHKETALAYAIIVQDHTQHMTFY